MITVKDFKALTNRWLNPLKFLNWEVSVRNHFFVFLSLLRHIIIIRKCNHMTKTFLDYINTIAFFHAAFHVINWQSSVKTFLTFQVNYINVTYSCQLSTIYLFWINRLRLTWEGIENHLSSHLVLHSCMHAFIHLFVY